MVFQKQNEQKITFVYAELFVLGKLSSVYVNFACCECFQHEIVSSNCLWIINDNKQTKQWKKYFLFINICFYSKIQWQSSKSLYLNLSSLESKIARLKTISFAISVERHTSLTPTLTDSQLLHLILSLNRISFLKLFYSIRSGFKRAMDYVSMFSVVKVFLELLK